MTISSKAKKLIAVSIFRRGERITEFADITIESGGTTLRVL